MPARRLPSRSALLRTVAGAAAGVLAWTALPPLSWWPAAFAAVAALPLLVRPGGRGAAAAVGYAYGLGYFVPMLAFLRPLGSDAWLVLSAGEAGWFALLALAMRAALRLRWWPAAVPALWVAQEFARDRVPFGGFPWGRLGYGQAAGPLLPLAALGGAVALTLAVATGGSLLAWLAVRPRRLRLPGAVTAGYAAGLALLVAVVPVPTAGTSNGGPSQVTVAVVQGNVPRLGLDAFAQRRAVTTNHEAVTEQLAADVAAGRVPRPDLVIWPENASDDDPLVDPVAGAMVRAAVAAIGVPVLVGAVLDGPGPTHVRNAAIVWSPQTGPGAIYVKRHLVPFGEYLPGRALLGHLISRFSRIGRDFVAGSRPGLLQVGPATIGDVICFEVADDGIVRDVVSAGGRLLVVQTNNATYETPGDNGQGGETAQQLEMARLRAVEHGRAVVVAATSGVSAVIAPDGRVVQRSGVFVPATLVATVPLRDPSTVADRLGPWPERTVAVLALLALLAAAATRPARRPRAAGPVASQPLAEVP